MNTNIWFTADTHIGHSNIIKYCNRPFLTENGGLDVEQMNIKILNNLNTLVNRDDTLFIIGDVGFGGAINWFLDNLNCQHVQIIWGNHDKKNCFKHRKIDWTGDVKEISIEDGEKKWKVFMSHYPHRSWPHKSQGAIHLFGHTHGRLPKHDRSMDVGVDTNGMFPYSWRDVKGLVGYLPVYSDIDNEMGEV